MPAVHVMLCWQGFPPPCYLQNFLSTGSTPTSVEMQPSVVSSIPPRPLQPAPLHTNPGYYGHHQQHPPQQQNLPVLVEDDLQNLATLFFEHCLPGELSTLSPQKLPPGWDPAPSQTLTDVNQGWGYPVSDSASPLPPQPTASPITIPQTHPLQVATNPPQHPPSASPLLVPLDNLFVGNESIGSPDFSTLLDSSVFNEASGVEAFPSLPVLYADANRENQPAFLSRGQWSPDVCLASTCATSQAEPIPNFPSGLPQGGAGPAPLQHQQHHPHQRHPNGTASVPSAASQLTLVDPARKRQPRPIAPRGIVPPTPGGNFSLLTPANFAEAPKSRASRATANTSAKPLRSKPLSKGREDANKTGAEKEHREQVKARGSERSKGRERSAKNTDNWQDAKDKPGREDSGILQANISETKPKPEEERKTGNEYDIKMEKEKEKEKETEHAEVRENGSPCDEQFLQAFEEALKGVGPRAKQHGSIPVQEVYDFDARGCCFP